MRSGVGRIHYKEMEVIMKHGANEDREFAVCDPSIRFKQILNADPVTWLQFPRHFSSRAQPMWSRQNKRAVVVGLHRL
jgi:hypothetical protein